VIYTNPNFQRVDLTLEVIAKLAAHPRIRYIKDASTIPAAIVDHESMRRYFKRILGIGAYSGGGDADRGCRLDGGTGLSHSPPKRRALQSLHRRLLDDAMKLQRRLWRLNEAFARYNLAACIKAGLAIQGYEVGDPVPPQAALTADERKVVEAVLRDIG